MIKPWVFEFLPELGSPTVEPDPRDVTALYARYLDLWVRDEALGFEGIFFSEHHFGRSYSPSPNLLIATLAQRTKTLRLGVMGVVLPYYHPARVIEEIGMLDHLTSGRLEIGTAIGVPQELARLNMTMAEARERNDEIVAVMEAAFPIGWFPIRVNTSRFPICAFCPGRCSNRSLPDGQPSSAPNPRGAPLGTGSRSVPASTRRR